MARFKVFRTAIGFHDAYVAATSRKAALAAWGSDKDLFAHGAAEEVTDPALAAESLADPGTVIKRLRGTVAEQLAALPASKPTLKPKPKPVRPSSAKTAAPLPPEPSRDQFDAAEAALAAADARRAEAIRLLEEREAALAREREALERGATGERQRLQTRPRRGRRLL